MGSSPELGMRFEGETQEVEFEPDQELVKRMMRFYEAQFTLACQPDRNELIPQVDTHRDRLNVYLREKRTTGGYDGDFQNY